MNTKVFAGINNETNFFNGKYFDYNTLHLGNNQIQFPNASYPNNFSSKSNSSSEKNSSKNKTATMLGKKRISENNTQNQIFDMNQLAQINNMNGVNFLSSIGNLFNSMKNFSQFHTDSPKTQINNTIAINKKNNFYPPQKKLSNNVVNCIPNKTSLFDSNFKMISSNQHFEVSHNNNLKISKDLSSYYNMSRSLSMSCVQFSSKKYSTNSFIPCLPFA